jgi:undecaprenyl-diphosphatase
LLLYRKYVLEIILGLLGKSESGKKLALNIFCGTLPVLLLGFLLKGVISTYLQFTGPVLLSLAVGGVVMIGFERFRGRRANDEVDAVGINDLSWKQAFMIGGLQCLALWPGTSRSMVTIIGGMQCGLKRPAAAEFSFLLGLPALLAATLYKLLKDGDVLFAHVGSLSLFVGFITSTIFAALAVRWLVGFLNRNGLAYFGWYRIALAAVIFMVVGL